MGTCVKNLCFRMSDKVCCAVVPQPVRMYVGIIALRISSLNGKQIGMMESVINIKMSSKIIDEFQIVALLTYH